MGKKILSLLLALVMLFALAACGVSPDDNADETAPPDSAAATDDSAEDWYGIAPLEGDPVTLTWYCINTGSDISDQDAVMAEVNKLLLERYNIQLNWVIWDMGEYDDKINLIINSGEEFDLCYTSEAWVAKYNSEVEKGAFLALDEAIDEYEPGLWEVLPDQKWDAARYTDGQVYAVPNTQKCFSGSAICAQQSYADEFGLTDQLKVDDNGFYYIDDISELYPFWDWCLKNYPDLYCVDIAKAGLGHYQTYVNLDRSFESLTGTDCYISTPDYTVTDAWDLELAQMDIFHTCFINGYIRSDIATVTDNSAEIKADRYICRTSVFKPGQEAEYTNSGNGAAWYQIRIGDPIVTKEAVRSTMTAISQTCQNVPAALKLLNVLYHDADVVSLLNYGIEGTHWEYDADGLVSNLGSGYFYNQGWATGLQFLLTPTTGNAPDLWEVTQAIENSAKYESIMTFTPDYESLSTELSQIAAVLAENIYLYTETDESAYQTQLEAFRAALDSAGKQTVVTALQTQIDAWRAAQ